MTTEKSAGNPQAHDAALQAHRAYLHAGLLFACVFVAGVAMASIVAPALHGFDRWLMLSMGSALASAATAFIMVSAFLLDLRA